MYRGQTMHLDTSYSLLIICPMDQKGFYLQEEI